MNVIRSIMANVRGTSHYADDIPCQDKYCFMKQNETFVFSLCDGAGSRRFSDKGAEIASETVCSLLCDDFYSSKETILDSIISSLSKLGEQLGDFASTMMFIAIRNNEYYAGHIGDGVIGICRDKFEVLSKPQNGLYKNETVFTTDDSALENLRVYRGSVEDVQGFIMMTDGLSDSIYSSSTEDISPSVYDLLKLIESEGEEEAESVFNEIIKKHIVPRTNDDISGVIISLNVE